MMCLASLTAIGQTTQASYEAYIQQYYRLAQEQQREYGVPASITLAQGLLESGAGRAPLAQKANNHFGIKCASNWTGATYTQDDDAKDECFRKYKQVEESFRDHSLFLKRPRYAELFTLDVTDYKGWAHGLKRCGYATDPAYAGKLIKLIEDYNLTQYVTLDETTTEQTEKIEETKAEMKETAKKTDSSKSTKKKKSHKTSKKTTTTKPASVDTTSTTISTVRPAKQKASMGSVDLFAEHSVKRINGCKYVVAREGDTFQSIAAEFNIRTEALYQYNDVNNKSYTLQAGDKIYLQMKRRKAEKRYAVYRVRRNENIWQIAQDKGIRVETIYRLNGIDEGQDVSINQELRLR